MNKMTVLVVEDDRSVRNLLVTTLRTHGYRHLEAQDGEEAIVQASSHNPDVILLDLGLPDMEGTDVIARVRTWSNMPIIVVSARNEDADKIAALDAGADDYLTKPFSVEELMARLRVTQRRLAYSNTSMALDARFENGALRVDYAANTASMNGVELRLTPIEYRLLCLLAQNVDKVLTHTFLTQKIWGKTMDTDIASLRVYMATLRKKLDRYADGVQYIQTHVGIGYRMTRV